MLHDDEIPLEQKLNLETGRISWLELQRYFARGVIIIVQPPLDLIDIARLVASNHADQIAQLIEDERLTRASDEHARDWHDRRPMFWAVVVAPWVLIQEVTD